MVKSKTNSRSKKQAKKAQVETDSAYFLKLVMYLILSSVWIRVTMEGGTKEMPLPIGAIIALIFASHDHFKMDRKIEFALILVGMFVAFWLPVGIFVAL
jgi:ABC-type transport system involved in cytochrome bd biosynthesis fused ATPase/permease subunit